jgi:hypothetical protein
MTHYWPLNSYLIDLIGDADLCNGINYNYTAGKYFQSLSLDFGSIMIPEARFFPYNMFTIMTWVKLTGISPGARIFEFFSNSSTVLLLTSNDRILYGVRSLNGALLSSLASLKIGQWTHLALTLDQNKRIKLFIDGKLDSHGMVPQRISTNSLFTRNYIGGGFSQNGTQAPGLNASIDEVKIFDYDLQIQEIINEIL